MVKEVLSTLLVKLGGTYLDCTVGEGGHTEAILATTPNARLIGIDKDVEALVIARRRLEKYSGRSVLVHGSYTHLDNIVREHGMRSADGILFDLGISSLQIESGDRGFSIRREARLDMRFDPAQEVTAHQLVNGYPERALADIIYQLGEEPKAKRVAREIVRSRPIETTTELAGVVARAIGRESWGRTHVATRTFQALRMAVNQELDSIRKGLDQAIEALSRGGRLAIISYHSLEDRQVKTAFRRESSKCICPPGTPQCICGHTARIKLVNRKVIKPTGEEVKANPRSRSARLRVAERI
jgi:16S rRNA (cytosine1402-N4)-methyltransferase